MSSGTPTVTSRARKAPLGNDPVRNASAEMIAHLPVTVTTLYAFSVKDLVDEYRRPQSGFGIVGDLAVTDRTVFGTMCR